jgi:hypothetical protein
MLPAEDPVVRDGARDGAREPETEGAPPEGLIVFYQPGAEASARAAGRAKRTASTRSDLHTVILNFTTAEEDVLRQKPNVHVVRGEVGARSDKDIAEHLFRETSGTRGSWHLLTPGQFGRLWSRLEGAGLFKLRPSPGKEPPPDRTYFLIRTARGTTVYTRPAALDDRWDAAILEVVRFVNEL